MKHPKIKLDLTGTNVGKKTLQIIHFLFMCECQAVGCHPPIVSHSSASVSVPRCSYPTISAIFLHKRFKGSLATGFVLFDRKM
jgi:hypothetical protein